MMSRLKQSPLAALAYRRAKDITRGRGWGGFHQDRIYQQLILEILRASNCTSFIETGTFRGYSTELVALNFPDILIQTCEVLPSSYQAATLALRRYPNIQTVLGSSEQFIQKIVHDPKLGSIPMFYLDAHWQTYWPLRDELRAITTARLSCVISIDDFKVPGQPQFEFDHYTEGEGESTGECDWEYIGPAMSAANTYHAIYPAYTREEAFGNRATDTALRLRGQIILFQNCSQAYEASLKAPSVLRHARGIGRVEPGGI